MRIVIDMQGAQSASRFRGIGRYSTALAQAMIRNGSGHDFWVVTNGQMDGVPELREAFSGLLQESRFVSFSPTSSPTHWQARGNAWRRSASELMREFLLRDLMPDRVHVSSLIEGAQDRAITSIGRRHGPGVPTAATLYDLIPLHNPEYLAADWVREWYASKTDALQRADLLLAISDYAREEAIGALGIDESKIVNISAAASDAFRPIVLSTEARAALLARYGINGRYVMYSGAMDVRKNVDRLVEAFARLPDDVIGSCQLLIAGKLPDLEQERLHLHARRNGLADDRLLFAGYVGDDELVSLYGAADLYVFPSLHEGFGLPALEAMACGTPTIGSSVTSIPEVIGRQDALFDPKDPQAIADRMLQVLSDEGYARSLREHALEQSRRFSWDESAKRALEAFESEHEANLPRRSWSAIIAASEESERMLLDEIASLDRSPSPPSERDLIEVAAAMAANQSAVLQAHRYDGVLPDALRWRIEGPFDSSYSLALVNRELALALDGLGNEVALHSTEGPGDFPPSREFLESRPEIQTLHERVLGMPPAEADVSSRLLYPPRVADMSSRFNMLHDYAWEESEFPWEWVDAFNDALQGICALSTHVEKILIDSGIDVPVAVGEAGVDHWDRVKSDASYACEGKAFRFLHVSSCFPRKGVDVLLQAYGDTFTSADDVSLIIKTFANPHNEIDRWLNDARRGRTDFPDVRIIEDDLSESQLKRLYETSHVLVAPSRAEGFGLPMAEAMISDLAVITTAWGGQLDFCRPDTAWLVDYEFQKAQTHFGLFNSVWAEPSRTHLAECLREVYELPAAQRTARVERGKALLAERFQWRHVAERTAALVRDIAATPRSHTAPSVAWISTWNTKCGIASYSRHLIDNLGQGVHVLAPYADQHLETDAAWVDRCWDTTKADGLLGLEASLDRIDPEVVVLQFQYGFFEFVPLARLLRAQRDAGRVVVVMMHATQDPEHVPDRRLTMLVDALRDCDRILVHSVGDLNRLKRLGLVDNVAIFPHGIVDFDPGQLPPSRASQRFELASYGFCLPHKGLPELVDAVAILLNRGYDVGLRMVNAEYPVGESAALVAQLRERVAVPGLADRIALHTAYLPDTESFAMLHTADLIVFPYQGTSESSSAAVRYGLATARPVAVTPIAIFDDVGDTVVRLPGTSATDLADGIASIIDDRDALLESQRCADRWREAHRYTRLGRRLSNILRTLLDRRIGPGASPRQGEGTFTGTDRENAA